MATRKNRTQLYIALCGLLGVVIGTFGNMLLEHMKPKNYSEGIVQEYQGTLLFIRSRPKETNFKSHGIVSTDAASRAVEAAQHKKGFGKFLESIGKSIIDDIPFQNRLDKIIVEAKHAYPKFDGLIFNDDLTQCEIIEFP